ncbi:zinc-binding dehydrogenase [Prauserella oleivorans]|uniref:Zinc-binding dehydrogenase n=1 Tax=Prauserella oleivorans TaxID=1478153 RepID=A0ABW5W9J2_9PSEU
MTDHTDTMMAVRLETATGNLSVTERPVPHAGRDQVRLRVEYAGVCHSDLHFVDGELAARMPREVTLGHEIAGVIDEIGDGVTGHTIGERVLVHPVGFVDGETSIPGVQYDGGWATYVVVPAERVLPVGPDLPFDQAAIIPDAVATPWAAITDAGRVRPAEAAAVWGLGGLGYHAVKLLRLVGATPVIAVDPAPAARARALRAGADLALDPTAEDFADRLASAGPIDVAFDFVGNGRVQQQAFDAIEARGRVVLVGIPQGPLVIEDSARLIRLQKSVIGSYGSERHHTEELVRLAAAGRLDLSESITEVLPLDQAETALDHLRNQVGNPIRIVLRP